MVPLGPLVPGEARLMTTGELASAREPFAQPMSEVLPWPAAACHSAPGRGGGSHAERPSWAAQHQVHRRAPVMDRSVVGPPPELMLAPRSRTRPSTEELLVELVWHCHLGAHLPLPRPLQLGQAA